MFSTTEEAMKSQLLGSAVLGNGHSSEHGLSLAEVRSSDEGVSGWIPFLAV